MKAIKFFALVGLVALVAVACQSAPEESANAPAEEAVAATAAPNADAADAPAAAAPAEQPERREPEAPRAEGDRLAELLASDDYLLLDVRRPDELERLGTVEGYLNIPIEELADRLDEVPRDRPILTA
jgi:hypothetical protein